MGSVFCASTQFRSTPIISGAIATAPRPLPLRQPPSCLKLQSLFTRIGLLALVDTSVVARRWFRFLQPCSLSGDIIFCGDQCVFCGLPRSLDGVLLHHKVRKNLDVDFEDVTFPTPPLLKSRVSQLARSALYSFHSSLPCRREINTYCYITVTGTLPPALDNIVFI